MSEANLTECELAYQLTYHPFYMIAQFWSFFVSLLAMPSLIFFMVEKVFKLPFHGNLKFLLVSYFIGTFLFASIICFTFGYHFFVPFFVTSNCDLIINATLFKYGHMIALIFMTIPMILPTAFTVERFVALKMAHSYEHVRTLLGPVLVLVVIAIDSMFLYDIYGQEKFDKPFINFILVPATSALQFNSFLWYMLYLKITNFICNLILLFIHKILHQRYRRKNVSLSVKYEMQEISQSSRFTLIVTFTHLLFFGWYVSTILLIRTVGPDFFRGFINYTVMRGVYCATPTYNLVIVFIGFKALNHLNFKRNNKVQSTIQIKSTGQEGAENYDNAISNYWDSVYTMNKSKL
ncbi:Serpentine receptor class beta-12 [Caenorhabditis elegans]|uniref:Isoform a of Serpentine receptor class beta-12 n=1 Tax=Caenorhabditis elegans TaxID=6239 RepID=A0A3B1DZW5-2|nr:Serpentine receptor class beta-12 [Caenorhabditis elegans]CCD65840.1 Serpentine receptor class beta-12 [Caenorhabditis elegans]|eukprot:NP_494957.1 Serpentine Receptor, class B (beta) [Caenorhabditis elegans]